MSTILMATLFYKALILQGEIWRYKGYNSFARSKPIKGVLPNHGKTERQDLINLKR